MSDCNEVMKVSDGMIGFGGSFVRALGFALRKADLNNQRKIKATWPEYWDKYYKMGRDSE